MWEKMDACKYMIESLCCLLETTTPLLIGHAPIQNKSLNFEKKKNVYIDSGIYTKIVYHEKLLNCKKHVLHLDAIMFFYFLNLLFVAFYLTFF